MCISCREKFEQKNLLRLQCIDANVVSYTSQGRSFYLCVNCIDKKQTLKALSRQCRSGTSAKFMSQIKEIIANVR
ncbi:MAG: DUF448 domain-containing protein [Campylobacterota bacterium]|nr:DUF448 domain-containing protein [Campylobacterota bacterium]